MTRLIGHKLPEQRSQRGLPHWLVFAIATVAFSVPIAGMLLMVWPILLQRTSLVVDDVELICLAIATVLIAGTLASYVHRDQGRRL